MAIVPISTLFSPEQVSTLPPDVASLLAPGEKVLWHGQPRPYVFMLRGIPNIAYGVTWAVLGAFWYRGSGGIGHNSVFTGWWQLLPLFSLPFILAGFSFFLAPMRLGARARRTWYVVTDGRVFLAELRRGQAPRVCEFTGENLIFSRRAEENPHLTPRLDAGFFGVENGEQALEAIRGLLR